MDLMQLLHVVPHFDMHLGSAIAEHGTAIGVGSLVVSSVYRFFKSRAASK